MYVFDKYTFLLNPLPCLEIKQPFILGTKAKMWKATAAHRLVEMIYSKTVGKLKIYTHATLMDWRHNTQDYCENASYPSTAAWIDPRENCAAPRRITIGSAKW